DTTATVNWSAPAPNGGSAISGYSVQVQTAAGVLVSVLPAGPDATSLVVTGLTNGTSYRFRVQATNAAGTGAFSALSNTVTPAVLTVPGAPTIGTAVAGNTTATVAWTPPASNGGSAITSFSVQVINPATGAQIALASTTGPTAGTATSLVVTGLTNGTSYQFRVRAINVIGSSIPSGLSNTITPTPAVVGGIAPGAPIIRNAASGAVGGPITAIANWRPGAPGSSPISGYRVTAIPTAGAPITSAVLTPGPGRNQSFEMTLPAGNYRFTVVAINATGPGVASAQSNQVTAR
ncbi:MAG: fibronectin type III domain-containing protein, partial [Ilumatobacteraceae bacterium]